MKLWSGTLSPFSAKVRIVLAEKGIEVDVAEIPWSREHLWGPKPPEFLAASHKGEVPVLTVDGASIVDSTVINEYLEEAHPVPPLMPVHPFERAECRMWEDMADYFLAEHVTTLITEVFMQSDPEKRDAAAIARAYQAFNGYLGAMERRLADSEYLCSLFSLADIATWVCLAFGQTLGVDLKPYACVQQWFTRVQSRPVVSEQYQQIMAAAAAS